MLKGKRPLFLTLGALGVVFGDIGTSPLYALSALFGPVGQRLAINHDDILGIVSLVVWAVTLVVSVKYVLLVMRADNRGEGGIMALVSILKESLKRPRWRWAAVGLGLIGMALFYGDSAITPAISVLSAVEGLKVVNAHLAHLIVPVTLAILIALFWLQRYGTDLIGHLFGPIMLLWFVTIGVGGGWQVVQHPEVLQALSPLTAMTFFGTHPLMAFIAMGAVVLAITGAEALYADMGHFGRPAVSRAWFFLVFPALLLCYLGQGALLIGQPAAATNPLFYLFPRALHIPLLILATLATLIASQAVISGAFSITRQAIHLDFVPKMLVRHTSTRLAGQVYMPFVNYALFITVVVLVLVFGSSARLANAYGIAVSGTLAIDTLLFIGALRSKWHEPWNLALLAAFIFVPLDWLFVASNLAKVRHGGWIPLVLAAGIYVLVSTWVKGQRVVVRKRRKLAGSLEQLVRDIHHLRTLKRYPGEAVYIGHHHGDAPLALRTTLDEQHELAETVLIISVVTTNAAHVPEAERLAYNSLGAARDGISHLKLTYGFHDSINIPRELALARRLSPELNVNPSGAAYFISLYRIVPTKRRVMAHWRKAVYDFMLRNALSNSDFYHLPLEHTEEVISLLKL